jgi:acyl-coenzyme A thioesterase PaaI-like protein
VDLLADCDLIKIGRHLAVGEVTIRQEVGEGGEGSAVAHLTATYSIPPRR